MRRVAIAGVLASKPNVYVLDEPTAGLDPKGQKEIMNMFYNMHHEEKITTILVTHSMEDALNYSDYLIILNKGEKYMEGRPEDIFTKEKDLHEVQLQVPESIKFLNQYNQQFNTNLPLAKKSPKDIAALIKQTI